MEGTMFEFLKYNALFTTFDMGQYVGIQTILKKNDIFFKTKIINNSHQNVSGLGRAGGNSNYNLEYQILVKNEDYEKAKFFTKL